MLGDFVAMFQHPRQIIKELNRMKKKHDLEEACDDAGAEEDPQPKKRKPRAKAAGSKAKKRRSS